MYGRAVYESSATDDSKKATLENAVKGLIFCALHIALGITTDKNKRLTPGASAEY